MVKLEGMRREHTDHFEKLANSALSKYPLQFHRIQFVGYYTNCILLAESGPEKYALRISSPGWRTFSDLNSEAIWLHDLTAGSDIGVVEPVMTRKGKYLSTASYKGSRVHYCLLMKWLNGDKLWENINSRNIFKMGELFAKLHLFSESYKPPVGFTTREMNRIFARGEKVALYKKDNREMFSPAQYDIILKVKQQTDEVYKRLYAEKKNLMVISHDLHHENIIIDAEGNLRPFDFEDTCLGYPVQDIAMAMRDLMEDRPQDFELYLSDFREGYETLRKWPETYQNQIDDFMAGRMRWVANWILINDKDGFSDHLKWAVPKLEKYLITGLLRY